MAKKPEPVDLVNADGEVIATACVKRPPGRREPEWYWQVTYIDPVTGGRRNTGLGRLSEEQVGEALREKLRELIPGLINDDGSGIRTLDALVEAWAAWQETRGSKGSKQIADSTVTAYLGNAARLAPYIRGVECQTLNRGRFRSIREAMDKDCDSRRTVNGDMKALKQAIIWGREQGVSIPEFRSKGITTLPVNDSHRVNNFRTPTHDEVEKVFNGMRTTPSRLALFIAWKTGARIQEVTSWLPDLGPDDDRSPEAGLPVDKDGQCWIYFPHRKNGEPGGVSHYLRGPSHHPLVDSEGVEARASVVFEAPDPQRLRDSVRGMCPGGCRALHATRGPAADGRHHASQEGGTRGLCGPDGPQP